MRLNVRLLTAKINMRLNVRLFAKYKKNTRLNERLVGCKNKYVADVRLLNVRLNSKMNQAE